MSGVVQPLLAIVGPLSLKSIPQGAATQVFAAVHSKALPLAGQYLADCNAATPRRDAEDAHLAQRLWKESEEIVQELFL